MLSKKAIESYQEAYLKTYGKEISFAEAEVQARQLLALYKVVLQVDEDGGAGPINPPAGQNPII
jgi:hypothetical protein